jgi:hypothetical protein
VVGYSPTNLSPCPLPLVRVREGGIEREANASLDSPRVGSPLRDVRLRVLERGEAPLKKNLFLFDRAQVFKGARPSSKEYLPFPLRGRGLGEWG